MKNLNIPLKNLDIYAGSVHFIECERRWKGEHCFDANQFYYVVRGAFVLNIGEHSYIVREKQLALLPAKQHHTYWLLPGTPTTIISLTFNARCHGKDFFQFLGLADDNHVVTVPEADFMQCYNLMKRSDFGEYSITDYVMRSAQYAILCGIYARARISMENAKNEYYDVISYMKAHVTEDLSLDTLAEAFHFNASYFAIKFKNQMGISPMKYFAQLRAQHAAKLLRTTDMSVPAVAAATGFNDIYYFKTFFSKHMGVRPENFRDIFVRPPELRFTEH